jgi:hypothetical protein
MNLAHGPARNFLNVSGSFRTAQNYKSLKFNFWPENHIRARNSVFTQNSHQSPKFKPKLIKIRQINLNKSKINIRIKVTKAM